MLMDISEELDLGFDDDVLIFDALVEPGEDLEDFELYVPVDASINPENPFEGGGAPTGTLAHSGSPPGHSRWTETKSFREGSLKDSYNSSTNFHESHRGSMPDPATYNIYSACKAGHLGRVRYLVEVEDVDINRQDIFDSVPLFYACLCGHAHVVKYLLDKGAILDASTFVGARCYYGALDDTIRQLLRTYHAKPSGDLDPLAQAYAEVLSMSPDTPFADFEFVVEDRPIRIHRFVVAAQCPYLRHLLYHHRKWKNRSRLRFRDTVRIKFGAVMAFLKYLYTDELQIELGSADLKSLLYLLEKFRMNKLRRSVVGFMSKAAAKGMRQVILRSKGMSSRLRTVFEGIFNDRSQSDLRIVVDRYTTIAHRVVLYARVPYFRVMFSSCFRESAEIGAGAGAFSAAGGGAGGGGGLDEDENGLSSKGRRFEKHSCIRIDSEVDVVSSWLEYVYTGKIGRADGWGSVEGTEGGVERECKFWYGLLELAELYMMDDLKLVVFRQFCRLVRMDNLWKIMAVGVMYGSRRVIDAVLDFVRMNLASVSESPEFGVLLNGFGGDPLLKDLRQLIEDELPEPVWEYMLLRNKENLVH